MDLMRGSLKSRGHGSCASCLGPKFHVHQGIYLVNGYGKSIFSEVREPPARSASPTAVGRAVSWPVTHAPGCCEASRWLLLDIEAARQVVNRAGIVSKCPSFHMLSILAPMFVSSLHSVKGVVGRLGTPIGWTIRDRLTRKLVKFTANYAEMFFGTFYRVI